MAGAVDQHPDACGHGMDAATLQARAEFWLCLARAFAPPTSLAVLRDDLPADLAELATATGYPLAAPLADYRAAIAGMADDTGLLRCYARLFLVPGAAHPSLNTGAYLDGAIGGGSVTAMLHCYQRCGLAPDTGLNDLPDHLTVQFEFLAWLFGAEARARAGEAPAPALTAAEFLGTFVARWSGPFAQEIAAAEETFQLPATPWRALMAMLTAAVETELAAVAVATPTIPAADPEIARLRAAFAGRSIGEADLAFIRERLAADGLVADHVAIPVDARDRVMGLATMTPPSAPSHRL